MSWLASYEIRTKLSQNPNEVVPVEIRKNTLGYGTPYMYSFFYATATITSGNKICTNSQKLIYPVNHS